MNLSDTPKKPAFFDQVVVLCISLIISLIFNVYLLFQVDQLRIQADFYKALLVIIVSKQ